MNFDTKEYRAMRSRVIAGESKLIRETEEGSSVLQEVPSPGKRYEDRGISLEALFAHAEGLFADAATSESIIDALMSERAQNSWDGYYLTGLIIVSSIVNVGLLWNAYVG